MKELDITLQSYTADYKKVDFMYEQFLRLKEKVDEVLLFGPCNSDAAEEAKKVYYSRRDKQGQRPFFSPQYRKDKLDALPAVIASSLSLSTAPQTMGKPAEVYEHFFKLAYLYGTGTCEFYAIVGAYFLATEFDVELSIETIYSEQSHTYIRLHTSSEFAMDFWSPMLCLYTDTISWNEFFGSRYMRDAGSEIKQHIRLNKEELLAMGKRVFSEENTELRLHLIEEVLLLVRQESGTEASDKESDLKSSECSGNAIQ
ncbi:hypothetical protein [Legionella maioricensis]|uniref:Uncharacterized protein n=1 Tax=Legionella maioricensis TaxID=2896528 RepID=A0A9X2D088_9GAMM|nr:hypothetical protein [Legionella maioricensis]MCL9683853.1 hypothetical protein [Legionella maioricensis]MCL9686700.1 hypothetical protein [Legionella maioricensis]